MVSNGQYSYLLFCLISSALFLLTIADNQADSHSNETIVEYNSTAFSLPTITNISNEEILVEEVKSNVSALEPLDNSTVFSTSMPLETTDGSILELNTTFSEDNVATTKITEVVMKKIDEQTTIVFNTSCELTPYGCCSDGVTKRMGPNNDGCANDEDLNVTITNNTVTMTNETDVTSAIKNENSTLTTEDNVLLFETSTEDISVVLNENNTTQVDVDNTTASMVENVTTSLSDDTITNVFTEATTEEVLENNSTETVETTTEVKTIATTTTVRSNLCVDSEFECCPNGRTPAQGADFQGCNTTEIWIPRSKKSSSSTVCELEKDAGSCSKYVDRWAYDRQQGKCIRFWYGSCEGNGNRFETEQQCQETCVSPKSIEVCLLPKMTGPCQSLSIRYYYDREKHECQQFRYGGCNGNANNYETIEKCQSTCAKDTVDQCTQSVEIGPCKGEFSRFYYDTNTGQCRSFLYGGCKKNANHFVTLKDCLNTCIQPRQKDICLQPKVIGTCQERRPTWYFDLIERECKLFQYSGCKGNHNRFSTKEECDLSCSSLKTSKTLSNDIKSLCSLPLIRGNCDQQISRWYFNPTDQYCLPYQYTGCQGNANSFETEQDCREICQANEKDICTFEKDSGTCDQYKIMWYHDTVSGQCKNFYYGSCGGNANRFATEQECQLRCLLKTGNSTCFQQVDQGHVCNDSKSKNNETTNPVMKFFYDQQLKRCSSFLYHGCGGNENRFDEENQCVEKCLTEVPTAEQGCGSNMIRCNIQCRFGFERDSNGCEICRCLEPCQRQQCPTGYECIIVPEQTQCVQAPCPVPRVECQEVNADQTGNANGGMKPLIENSITNIFSQFDANITIPCTLRQGYPTPIIYWYKERQQLQVHEAMSDGSIVRKIERLPDQSLLIRKVSLEDQGLYTCRAINEFGQDIKDVQLEIFDPIKVDIYPINRIYQLGFTAKLQCRATGYPLPRIIWMRENVPLVNTTRTTLQTDGSLIIHPYKPEDAGPYACNATNKKETVTQVAYLEVKETQVKSTCEDQPTFANCELVLRHNFCDVYFDYCCRTCSQHTQYSSVDKSRNRRHVFF